MFPSGASEYDASVAATSPASVVALVGYQPLVGIIAVTSPASIIEVLGYGGSPYSAEISSTSPVVRVLSLGGQPTEGTIAITSPASVVSAFGGVPIYGFIDITSPAAQILLSAGEILATIGITSPASRVALYAYLDSGVEADINIVAPASTVRIDATFPIFRLLLTINGEPVNAYWHRPSNWNVTKDGSIEDASFVLRNEEDSIDVYTPQTGDIVLLEHPVGGLIYGGKIKKVTRTRLGDGAGTSFKIDSGDWMFVTKRVIVPPQRFLPNFLLDFAEYVRATYMADMGIENIVPLTGGPEIPELIIDEPIDVQELLDRCSDFTGWPWRINGLQKYGFVEPGSLIWPGGELNGTNAKLTPQVTLEEEETISYNFLWMKLTDHPAGDGPYWHNETRFGDGVRHVFPVNVIPTEVECQLAATAEQEATVLLLKGLPAGAVVRQADSFFINSDPHRYYVSTGGTVDSNGNVTITMVDLLELKAEEGANVRFEPGAMINLKINGTTTEFGGSPWVWDKTTHAFVNPVAPLPVGHSIRYEAPVKGGGWVRAWETSDPPVQLPVGWFDNALMVAQKVENDDHWDWAESVAFLRTKITENVLAKRVVQLTTWEHGIYPFIQVTLNFPEKGISGDYICEKVDITSNEADPSLTDQDLAYNCQFRKEFYGKKDFDFWRPYSQIRWGNLEVVPPVNFQWSPSREYVIPGEQDGIELLTTAEWEWTEWTEVTSYAFADLIFTGIVVEQTDGYQPYYQWSRTFEIQLGVGPFEDPTVIANFKGHAKDIYGGSDAGIVRLMYPVDACPEGSAVWIRLRGSEHGGIANPPPGPWRVSVQAYAKPITGNLATTTYVQEVTTPGEQITEVTVAPVLGDWSDWVVILEETPYDLLLTGRIVSVYGFNDVSAAEIQWAVHDPDDPPDPDANVVINEAFSQRETSISTVGWYPWENPPFINSGKRISVRIKNSGDTSGGPRIGLSYVRFSE